jgi:transcriptional regulator with PAS, ATPase and Fis domain
VTKFNATVPPRVEPGAGKELYKALHELSPRAKRPFIKINSAGVCRRLYGLGGSHADGGDAVSV